MTYGDARRPSMLRGRAFTRALVAVAFLASGMATANAQSQAVEPGSMRLEEAPGRLVVLMAADYDAFTLITRRERQDRGTAPGFVPATFDVTYNDFSPQAQTAFQAAVDIWASVLESSQTIKVVANWTPLPVGQLGSARPTGRWRNFLGQPIPGFWYPSALADALGGADLDPFASDIVANFSSNGPNWYFGTDGNTPAGQTDLVTAVLHELGHGLGFSGSMRVDDGKEDAECNGVSGEGCFGRGSPVNPDIFDFYAETGAGVALIGLPQNSTTLGDELTSSDIFFDSPGATGANGGARPKLFAPNPATSSSYSHLDEFIFPAGDPNSLMTSNLGTAEAILDPGDIVLCMFEDMGWRTTAGCQGGGLIGPTVLHNQAVGCFGFTAISQFFTDFGVGVEAADDFVVEPEENWTIVAVAARGLYTNNGGPASSVNVTIYDEGFSPGKAVCSYPAQTPSAGLETGFFTFGLPTACNLGPGTYWLSVQAMMDLDPGLDQQQWNWIPNGFSSNGDSYEWRDVDNFFSLGCTSWTPHGSCPGVGDPADHDLCFGFLGPPGQAAEILADGFESGNTNRWSATVP